LNALKSFLDFKNNNYLNYNNVIITIYDLNFMINFNNANIDYTRFNLVSELEANKLICDNFYLIPSNIVPILYNLLTKVSIDKIYHHLYLEFNKLLPLNFIYNQKGRYVSELDFYKIVRYKYKEPNNKIGILLYGELNDNNISNFINHIFKNYDKNYKIDNYISADDLTNIDDYKKKINIVKYKIVYKTDNIDLYNKICLFNILNDIDFTYNDYDFIIIYPLNFGINKPINLFCLNYDIINIITKSYNLMDNILLIPNKYFKEFYEILINNLSENNLIKLFKNNINLLEY